MARIWKFTSSPAWALVLVMAFCMGCFSERSPKAPEENTGWISPTEPNILLENLRKAVVELNLNNYRRCLNTDNFRFKADPTLSANNIGLFATWNWDSENQFFNNLSQAAQPVNINNALIFTNTRLINHTSDSIEITADYQLSMLHQDKSYQAFTFAGLASFQMKRNRQNEWQISGWYDNKTKENPCWTELRQHFFAP
jgi:hypothetical protein